MLHSWRMKCFLGDGYCFGDAADGHGDCDDDDADGDDGGDDDVDDNDGDYDDDPLSYMRLSWRI